MISLEKLHMCIITHDTLMKIFNDPYVKSVRLYTDTKGLKCYNVVTMCGERYTVFTRGKIL